MEAEEREFGHHRTSWLLAPLGANGAYTVVDPWGAGTGSGGQCRAGCCFLESRKGLAFLAMPASWYAWYVPAQAHQAQQGRDAPSLWLRCLETALLERGGERGEWVWKWAPTSHTLLTTTAWWGQAEGLAAGPSSCSAPWAIYLANEQVFPLHHPRTAGICFAKPEGDIQHNERATDAPRNCTQEHGRLCSYYPLIDQPVRRYDHSLHSSCCCRICTLASARPVPQGMGR